MNRLADKNFLVTGATSGIGLATTRRLVAEGARVHLLARRAGPLDALEHELGDAVSVVAADVSDETAVRRAAGAAKERFGEVHGVYLNAGMAPFAPLGDVSYDLFEHCMRTNVYGNLALVRELVPIMPVRSAILLTGSGMHHRPLPNAAIWAASTFAVCGLGKALAVELAPKGIRVNVISHGPTDTPIYHGYGMPEAHVEAMKAGLADTTLLKRLAHAEEIAALAVMMLADECAYMTGAEVVCDGGWALAPASNEELS